MNCDSAQNSRVDLSGIKTNKLRAERKAGVMLDEMDRQQVGRPKKLSHDATISEIGISKDQSSRWQQEASMPEKEFEKYVAETKAQQKELTSAGILRLHQKRILSAVSGFYQNRRQGRPHSHRRVKGSQGYIGQGYF